MSFVVTKDPNAVLDYGLDWSEDLADGDTISASAWTVTSPADPTLVVGSTGLFVPSHTSTTTTVWLSGGTAGVTYKVTNHVTTAESRQDDRTLTVKCKEL